MQACQCTSKRTDNVTLFMVFCFTYNGKKLLFLTKMKNLFFFKRYRCLQGWQITFWMEELPIFSIEILLNFSEAPILELTEDDKSFRLCYVRTVWKSYGVAFARIWATVLKSQKRSDFKFHGQHPVLRCYAFQVFFKKI